MPADLPPALDPARTPSTPAPRITRGTVHAGASATDYLRVGCGANVVLLGADAADSPFVGALAARFRVVVPLLPDAGALPPTTSFSAWLRDFLDGLGVCCASLVAAEGCALRALSFALTDPLRVDRVALLFRDAPDPALTDAALPELFARSGLPLLVRRETAAGGGTCAGAVEDVVRFLCGEPPRADACD